MTADGLTLYTIYRDPRDFPGKWVTRRQVVTAQGPAFSAWAWVCDTLDEARSVVPAGFCNLGREPGDEPQIYETWV